MTSHPPDDLYALLGVDPSIDAVRLRQVWRKVARRWHPDHAGPSATAMFQKLSAAYEVLSDPAARAAYDRRRGGVAPTPPPTPASTGPRRPAPSAMLSRICGPLNSLLACGIVRRAADGMLELFLNAAEASRGGMVTISMRTPVQKAGTIVEELFSAWLAVSPGIADGTILTPSVSMPGMIQPVRFRIRISQPAARPTKAAPRA